MDGRRFDEITRAIGGPSRRSILRGIAGSVIAVATNRLPVVAQRGGNSRCARFCNRVFPEDVAADNKLRGRCKSLAARGRGICDACEADVSRVCGIPNVNTGPCCDPANGESCCLAPNGSGRCCNTAARETCCLSGRCLPDCGPNRRANPVTCSCDPVANCLASPAACRCPIGAPETVCGPGVGGPPCCGPNPNNPFSPSGTCGPVRPFDPAAQGAGVCCAANQTCRCTGTGLARTCQCAV